MRKLILLAAVLLFLYNLQAQYIQAGNKLVGSGSLGQQQAGFSLALSADSSTLVSGAIGLVGNGVSGGAFIFSVQDTNFAQQAVLLPSDNTGNANAGYAVAISGDGNTVVLGGPGDNNNLGAAWVFVCSGSTWTQQAKLVNTTFSPGSQQGTSVAISGDGNTIITGAPFSNDSVGSVIIYTRSGTTWTQQANLTGSPTQGQPSQGSTVSISYDGNTAAWVTVRDTLNAAAAWVFERQGSTWTQDGGIITGATGPGPDGRVGLALSGDGLTLAIGSIQDGLVSRGSVHVYYKSGSNWVYSQTVSSANYGTLSQSSEGEYIALSYNGSTLSFTGPLDGNGNGGDVTGHVYVFATSPGDTTYQPLYDTRWAPSFAAAERLQPVTISANGGIIIFGNPHNAFNTGNAGTAFYRGGQWIQTTASVSGVSTPGLACQGASVAVSTDGKTIIYAAIADSGVGAVYTFKNSGGAWSQYGSKFTGSHATVYNRFGSTLGLSGDGSTAVIANLDQGNVYDYTPILGAYSFKDTLGAWLQQGDTISPDVPPFVLDQFGYEVVAGPWGAVALSRDGSTMLVSEETDSAGRGGFWAYTMDNGAWVLQGNKIVGRHDNMPAASLEGASLAISGNGTVAAITSEGDSYHYIFRRTGSTWQQEFAVNSAQWGSGTPENPIAAISDDGNTVAMGFPWDSTLKGVVVIYHYDGSAWNLQANLTPQGITSNATFGTSLSLSADGNTLAAGVAEDGDSTYPYYAGTGAVCIFKRSGNTWSQYGNKLVASDIAGTAGFGTSVALTPDANSLVVGGSGDNSASGTVWTYNLGVGAVWVYNFYGVRVITDSVLGPVCSNDATGKIFAHATGGLGPYQYQWSVNGAANADSLTQLLPGIYYLTVFAAGGDSTTTAFEIEALPGTFAITQSEKLPCNYNDSGAITLHVSNGIAPYSYHWNTSTLQTDSVAVMLSGGAYDYTVTDSTGCAVTGTAALPATQFWTSGYATATNCAASNGSILIHPYQGTPPYSFLWSNGETSNPATGLQQGTYTFTVTDSAGCVTSATLQVDSFCLLIIEGVVFADTSNSCSYTNGESILPFVTVTATQNGYSSYSATNTGYYQIEVQNPGTYQLSVSQPWFYNCAWPMVCPDSQTVTFDGSTDTILNHNIGLNVQAGGFDLDMFVSYGGTYPGGQQGIGIWVWNAYPYAYTDTASIVFNYDPGMIYDSSIGAAPVNDPIGHTLTWHLDGLPNQYNQLVLWPLFSIPVSDTGVLNNCVAIYPLAGDCDTSNNFFCFQNLLGASFDPNYKSCTPDSVIEAGDSVLTYTIHFQNTGSDTARFIVIKDSLSQYVNPPSVVTVAAYPPNYSFSLSQNGILTWTFDPANLPDSSTNAAGSIGFITYKLKVNSALANGTIINNRASIYFDYNGPVATNTHQNIVNTPLVVNNIAAAQQQVTVFPNPFGNYTTFKATGFNNSCDFNLTDVTGKTVVSKTGINPANFELDRGTLAAGIYMFKITDTSGHLGLGKVVIQ